MTSQIEGLREREKDILEILKNGTSMYITEIIEHDMVESSRPTVHSHLADLHDEGLVEKEKIGRKVYYTYTEKLEELDRNKRDMKKAAEDWLKIVEEQIDKFEQDEITVDEFMERTYGQLVPLLFQTVFAEAYTRAIDLADESFVQTSSDDLNRRQEELILYTYDICRGHEVQARSQLFEVVDDLDGVDHTNYLNRPISLLVEIKENGIESFRSL